MFLIIAECFPWISLLNSFLPLYFCQSFSLPPHQKGMNMSITAILVLFSVVDTTNQSWISSSEDTLCNRHTNRIPPTYYSRELLTVEIETKKNLFIMLAAKPHRTWLCKLWRQKVEKDESQKICKDYRHMFVSDDDLMKLGADQL